MSNPSTSTPLVSLGSSAVGFCSIDGVSSVERPAEDLQDDSESMGLGFFGDGVLVVNSGEGREELVIQHQSEPGVTYSATVGLKSGDQLTLGFQWDPATKSFDITLEGRTTRITLTEEGVWVAGELSGSESDLELALETVALESIEQPLARGAISYERAPLSILEVARADESAVLEFFMLYGDGDYRMIEAPADSRYANTIYLQSSKDRSTRIGLTRQTILIHDPDRGGVEIVYGAEGLRRFGVDEGILREISRRRLDGLR